MSATTKPGWMNLIDDREVRVQTADGEEIKIYLTHDGRLWMSPVVGSDGSKRLGVSSVELVAAQQIEAHISTLGDHSACDPKKRESLCGECAEILGEARKEFSGNVST
jgi:hypothetical protein